MGHAYEPTRRVFALFLANPDTPLWGYDICQRTGLTSGTVQPMLKRWEQRGLLTSTLEENASVLNGRYRPRRRYFQLTDHGRQFAPMLANPEDHSDEQL